MDWDGGCLSGNCCPGYRFGCRWHQPRNQHRRHTSHFESKQQRIGASVTIGAGVSGSVSASSSKTKSDYANVAEQSGFKAGDGGFQVNVKGDSDLKGGTITSTDKAVQENKNTFTTGGQLTTSDIQNSANYSAKSVGATVGTSQANDGTFKPAGNSAGIGSDKGSASSTTQAGISGIAGNKTARTGDAETGINKIFDAEKVQKDIDAQVLITRTFGAEASKAVGDYASKQTTQLKFAAEQESDPTRKQALLDDAAKWDEGGLYRTLAHTAIGGLTGGAAGAAGAGAAAYSADAINKLTEGLPDGVKQAVGAAVATGIGAAVGGTAGAATAFNEDLNNRQLHPDEVRIIKDNARRYADLRKIPLDQAEAELTQQALRNVDSAHATRLGNDDPQAQAFLQGLGAGLNRTDALTGQQYQFFAADEATRNNHAEFGQYAKTVPTVASALDRAYQAAFKPKDGQTIAGLNGSNAGALTGSDLALNDAARDYRNMRQQPAVVQWAVLGELRQERRDNLQTQLQLTQELEAMNARGDTSPAAAQRRTDITVQLTKLELEDLTLRQASVEQIRAMGSAGTLKPADQREWIEGSGSAIAAAGLSGRGASAASITSRINALKGAIEETQAIAAAAKAEAASIAKVKTDINARTDDTQQYDQFRKADSTKPGGEWDWQKQAPNNGAVPGTQQTVTVQPGQTLDRYGSRNGEYMSPSGTAYEARSLPPGKMADPYEQYSVLKPFVALKEQIAPAFDQPGLGYQMRAYIPEYMGGTTPAPINELIKNNYLGVKQ